eukprot:gene5115-8713_t
MGESEIKNLLGKNRDGKSLRQIFDEYHKPVIKLTNFIILTLLSVLLLIGGSVMKGGKGIQEFGITFLIFSSISFLYLIFSTIILRNLIDIRIGIKTDLLTTIQQIIGFFLYILVPITTSIAMLVSGALVVDDNIRAKDVHTFCIIWGAISLGIDLIFMVIDFFIFNGNYTLLASKIISLIIHFGGCISLIVGCSFILDGKLIQEFGIEFIIFSSIGLFMLIVIVLVLRYFFLDSLKNLKKCHNDIKNNNKISSTILDFFANIVGFLIYCAMPFAISIPMLLLGIQILTHIIKIENYDLSIFGIVWGSSFLLVQIILLIIHFLLSGGKIRFN